MTKLPTWNETAPDLPKWEETTTDSLPEWEDTEPVEEESTTAGEAFGMHALDSVMFNFLDEVEGGRQAAQELNMSPWTAFMPTALVGAIKGMTPEQLATYQQVYTKHRDAKRAYLELLEQNHPVASIAGSIAGIAPQMLIPMGAAARGGSVLSKMAQAAKIEAPLGALYGAGSAREMRDIPKDMLIEGAIGAGAAGGLTGLFSGIGSLRKTVGKRMADNVLEHIKGAGQRVEERAAARLEAAADDEALMARAILLERNAQHIGDPVEWARRVDSKDMNELAAKVNVEDVPVNLSWSSKAARAHDVALAERLEWGRWQLGHKVRKADDNRVLSELAGWMKREGREFAQESYGQFRKHKQITKLVEDGVVSKVEAMAGGWVPPWARRISMAMTDARYVMSAIDRRWGTTTGAILDDVAEGYNRSNVTREAALTKLRQIHKDIRKSGVYDEDTYRYMVGDRQFEETAPKLYLALEHPRYAEKLSGVESSAVKQVQQHYEMLRETARELRLPVGEVENYVPHFTKATPKFIQAVKKRANELGIRSDGSGITTEPQWSRFEQSLDEHGKLQLNELRTALRMISSGSMKTREEILNAMNKLNDVKFVHSRLESQAAQTFKRTNNYVPTFIREVDAMLLADRWASQVYKHIFMRKGMLEMRSAAKWMRESGDENAANYIENWLADLNGTRSNTLAGNAKAALQTAQLKLDDLIERSDSRVARSFYSTLKQVPDLMQLMSGVVYSNLLGFNARVIMRNLTQPFVMTSTDIGGSYGQKLALKAQLDTMPTYMRKDFTSTRAIDKMGLLEAGIAPAKWTGEAVNVLERSMGQSLPATAVKKYSRVAMWLYEKSDFHNRMVTFRMSQRLSKDLVDGVKAMASSSPITRDQRAAIRFAKDMEAGVRTRVRMMLRSGDYEGVSKTISSHLNGKTQFHYNRVAMSEYGRFMGHMFSMFTKWPMSISGNMGDLVLEHGAKRGLAKIGAKYLGPLVLAGVLDKLVLPDPSEDERVKLLVGGRGLSGWTPAQSALGYATGEFITPPMIDAALRTLTTTTSANPESMARWLNQSVRYWVPGISSMKLLFDDIPTLADGENPKYVENWLENITED